MDNKTIDLINLKTANENRLYTELQRANARIAYLEAKMETVETLLDCVVDGQYTHAQKNGVALAAANFLRKARAGFMFTQATSNEPPF